MAALKSNSSWNSLRQSIIGKSGMEIILRGGQAKVIAGELGGLSDVTQGRI